MKLKVALCFNIVFLAFFTLSWMSSGEKLEEDDPVTFYDITNKFYILSSVKPYEIEYTLTFNSDGTIIGDCKSFFGSNYVKWDYEQKNIRIYNSSNDETISYMKFNLQDIVDKNDIPSIYKRSVPPFKIVMVNNSTLKLENTSLVYSNDINLIETKLKELKITDAEKKIWKNTNKKSADSILKFIQTSKSEELNEEACNALSKILSMGKFGGGFRDFKWGSYIKDVREKLKLEDKEDYPILGESVIKFGELEFYFYNNSLYQVVNLVGGFVQNEQLIENLNVKYGKAKIKKTLETSGEFGNEVIVTTKYYNWTDGITQIEISEFQSSKSSVIKIWNNLVYSSNHITKYKEKIEKEEKLKQQKKEQELL